MVEETQLETLDTRSSSEREREILKLTFHQISGLDHIVFSGRRVHAAPRKYTLYARRKRLFLLFALSRFFRDFWQIFVGNGGKDG